MEFSVRLVCYFLNDFTMHRILFPEISYKEAWISDNI